ncbi:hypothetical protein FZEAL_6447 [Fusarium zealandicum]|uniref:Uncharacterized protein n=1 Tax=Fusarium zealandicum TaxID=1053134 RepID=A0A8H4UHX4_9HYPO|nr:hypothetical protein FZEAL_6447 [Fusarium zealandicum]
MTSSAPAPMPPQHGQQGGRPLYKKEDCCQVCIALETGGSRNFHGWLQAHDALQLWQHKLEPEHVRYKDAVQRSEEVYQLYLARDKDIIASHLYFQARKGKSDAEMTPTEKAVRDTIPLAAAKVAEAHAANAGYERVHRNRLMDDTSGRNPYLSQWIVCEDLVTEAKTSIRVTTSAALRHSRWFLGRQGGTYIFQYRSTMNMGDPFMGSMPNTLNPDNFNYVGQVPRWKWEHMFRLAQLEYPVVNLFVQMVQYTAGREHPILYPKLEKIRHCRQLTADNFEAALEAWHHCFKDISPRIFMRNLFTSHPLIQEAAYILNALAQQQEVVYQHQRHFTSIVGMATGQRLVDIGPEFLKQLEECAWNCLRSGDDSHVMVYNDCEKSDVKNPELTFCVQNIYSFYRQQPHQADPLNPDVRHNYVEIAPELIESARTYRIKNP